MTKIMKNAMVILLCVAGGILAIFALFYAAVTLCDMFSFSDTLPNEKSTMTFKLLSENSMDNTTDDGFSDHIDMVVNGLYLSGVFLFFDERGIEKIKKPGITCVISIETIPIDPERQIDGVYYHFFYADDSEDEDLLYTGVTSGAVKQIEDCLTADKGVLVHCREEMSRSPTIVAAYLMKTNRWTRKETIDFLVSKRPSIRPNKAFLEQLDKFGENISTLL